MKDKESKVFFKGGTRLDVEDLRANGGMRWGAVIGKDYFGLLMVNGLSRELAEDIEQVNNGMTVVGIGSSKKG